MCKLLIDGDACPVIDICIDLAKRSKYQVCLYCDHTHEYNFDNIEICIVDKGKDSADFAIMRVVNKADIVITNDYGLASLVLSKQAQVCDFNGVLYTDFNILEKLEQRHSAGLLRKQHIKTRNPKKRQESQDQQFFETLSQLLTN